MYFVCIFYREMANKRVVEWSEWDGPRKCIHCEEIEKVSGKAEKRNTTTIGNYNDIKLRQRVRVNLHRLPLGIDAPSDTASASESTHRITDVNSKAAHSSLESPSVNSTSEQMKNLNNKTASVALELPLANDHVMTDDSSKSNQEDLLQPFDYEFVLRCAHKLQANKDFSSAIRIYTQLIISNSNELALYYYRARCYFCIDQFLDAIADSEQIISKANKADEIYQKAVVLQADILSKVPPND